MTEGHLVEEASRRARIRAPEYRRRCQRGEGRIQRRYSVEAADFWHNGMTPILLKTSLRYLLRHPWQIGLAILGVALGVAVVVSIDLDQQQRPPGLRDLHRDDRRPRDPPDRRRAERPRPGAVSPAAGRAGPARLGPGGRGLRLGARFQARPFTLHILGVDPLAEAPFRPYLSSANAGRTRSSPRCSPSPARR